MVQSIAQMFSPLTLPIAVAFSSVATLPQVYSLNWTSCPFITAT